MGPLRRAQPPWLRRTGSGVAGEEPWQYLVNGIDVTRLVDNPVANFFVLFVALGGFLFLIPWVIVKVLFTATGIGRAAETQRSRVGRRALLVLSILSLVLGVGIVAYCVYLALIGEFGGTFVVGSTVFLLVGLVFSALGVVGAIRARRAGRKTT